MKIVFMLAVVPVLADFSNCFHILRDFNKWGGGRQGRPDYSNLYNVTFISAVLLAFPTDMN